MITTDGFVMDVVWVAGIDKDEKGNVAYYFGVSYCFQYKQ